MKDKYIVGILTRASNFNEKGTMTGIPRVYYMFKKSENEYTMLNMTDAVEQGYPIWEMSLIMAKSFVHRFVKEYKEEGKDGCQYSVIPFIAPAIAVPYKDPGNWIDGEKIDYDRWLE